VIDLDRIGAIVRATAMAEVMPRFRALSREDIREKKPGDIADTEAERVLIAGLEAALPGSVALGEESVFADPTRLDLMAGEAPVWIIDPVDGTSNFAKGVPAFAVIVAYVERGAVEAGWIYDPIEDVLVAGARGRGAWSGGRRLHVGVPVPPGRTDGSAYGRTHAGVRSGQALNASGRFGTVQNRGSSGLEYMDVTLGRSHFTLHSRSLPWDHAAGMLLVTEAGGMACFLDGAPYDPRILDAKPLAASSAEIWHLVHDVVTARAGG
jgi:fructose-1,6-bisphosphatase/inositol monophosphatase family enzyme